MVIPLRNKYGILFLIAVCIMVSGCQQQKEETPFYYGTWDEGLAPGPTDGVKSATVYDVLRGNRELCFAFCSCIADLWHSASCHPDCSGNGGLRHDQTESIIFMGVLFHCGGCEACHLEYNRHSIFSCRLSADETEKSRKRRQGRKKAETALAYPKTRASSK